VDAVEAVAKAEEWLRAVHGPDTNGPSGVAVRVDTEHVCRVPEGWAVPYNTVAYLDEGRADKEIFPPPSLIVRIPEGDLRRPHPHPGGSSIPATVPGQEHWQEIVDHEWADAGLGHLGVPETAIGGWLKVLADGTKTSEQRPNPRYFTGPRRRGFASAENDVEQLVLFALGKWLTRERMLIGLVSCEVFVPVDAETGEPVPDCYDEQRAELDVFSSTRLLPPEHHAWRHVDLVTLAAEFTGPLNLVINRGKTISTRITDEELRATLRTWPRHKQKVDVHGRCPEMAEDLVQLAGETAARLHLPEPVRRPLTAAARARVHGFELTAEECRKTVLGESWMRRVELDEAWRQQANLPHAPSWPADLEANGLAPAYDADGRVVPRADTFGKYLGHDPRGSRFGWQRVVGAYVGFAIGEALGAAVDGLSLEEIRRRFGPRGITDLTTVFDRPGQLGSLTQRLLFYTEGAIRSSRREAPDGQSPSAVRNALLRWLHTQGSPSPDADGWLVRVSELHASRNPDAGELAAVRALADGVAAPGLSGPSALLVALPAAVTQTGGHAAGSRGVARMMAGLTHGDELDLEGAVYLAQVFEKTLVHKDLSLPIWCTSRDAFSDGDPAQRTPAWDELKSVVESSVPDYGAEWLPDLTAPENIGDGRSTLSVLGRAFAALVEREDDPEQALLRAVNHSGRSALTGALAGALLGARTGIPGLPRKWVEQLELRYLVENVATDAFQYFSRGSEVSSEKDWDRRYPRW
jgi:ADP-ribosylglycohydrolase